MRRITAAAFALALLGGCDRSPEAGQSEASHSEASHPERRPTEPGQAKPGQITVEEAWVRLPAAPGPPGAAYFTLRAHGHPAALERVASPRVERIELHETVDEPGVSRMTSLSLVPISEQGVLSFAPGKKHAMLFGIDPAVKEGDKIALTFFLRPGQKIVAEAEVRGPGGSAHSHH